MTEGATNLLTLLICLAVIVTFVRNKLPGMDALLSSAARFGVEFVLWIGYGVGLFFRWLGYAVILRRDVPVKHFMVRQRASDDAYVESDAPSEPSDSQDEAPSEEPSTASDGAALAIQDGKSDEPLNLTSVEIVRGLANVKRVDSDGNAVWLSKERIAALAGMRAADARAIIDEVRGTEKPAQPAKPVTPHAGREYDPGKYQKQPV